MGLIFKNPTLDDKQSTLAFKDAYLSYYDKTVIHGGAELHRFDDKSFDEWLDYVRSPVGTNLFGYDKVADDTFLAYLDDTVVGIIQIRYQLNEFLQKIGGHIGYSTHPDYKGCGIVSQMTAYALGILKQQGIDKALITCDDNNITSIKVIEKNGGVLQDTIDFNGKMVRRYWTDLS